MTTDLFARDLAYSLDPVLFTRECLGLEPDPWQAQVLRTESRRVLLNCSRQCGKSTVAAALALHQLLYAPGAQVLVISPSLRQSGELFRKALAFFDRLPHHPRIIERTQQRLSLAGGSRLISLPGNEATVRGFSAVTLLIEDEAARVNDDLYRAIRPMLAVSDGKMVLMSTPFGMRGHFFEEWTGEDEWERISITAAECPRITPQFLDKERRALGDRWYQQEYECRFVAAEGQLFDYETVMACLRDDIEPFLEEDRW